MAKSPLKMAASSEEFYMYSPKGHGHQFPHGSKGMSSFAFVLSIFIYTSVFYAFDISPSTLVSNTKFWFIISNTLILIIAADYGAFSSQKQNQFDLYEAYAAAQRSSRPGPVWEAAAPRAVYVREVNDDEKPQEKTISVVEPENEGDEGKEMVVLEARNKEGDSENSEDGSNGLENGLPDDDRSSEEESSASAPVPVPEATDGYEEKSVIVVSKGDDDESEESDRDGEEEGDDEFSAMSDEELNRRVEEFIWKLKRQIRLQGVKGLG